MIRPLSSSLPPDAATSSIEAATLKTWSSRGRSNCWLSTTCRNSVRWRAAVGIKKSPFRPRRTGLKVLTGNHSARAVTTAGWMAWGWMRMPGPDGPVPRAGAVEQSAHARHSHPRRHPRRLRPHDRTRRRPRSRGASGGRGRLFRPLERRCRSHRVAHGASQHDRAVGQPRRPDPGRGGGDPPRPGRPQHRELALERGQDRGSGPPDEGARGHGLAPRAAGDGDGWRHSGSALRLARVPQLRRRCRVGQRRHPPPRSESRPGRALPGLCRPLPAAAVLQARDPDRLSRGLQSQATGTRPHPAHPAAGDLDVRGLDRKR